MVQRRERDHRLRLCRCHLSTFQQLLGGLRGEKRLLLARNHRFYAVSSRFHRPKEVLLKLCAFGVTEFFLGPERVPLASCLYRFCKETSRWNNLDFLIIAVPYGHESLLEMLQRCPNARLEVLNREHHGDLSPRKPFRDGVF